MRKSYYRGRRNSRRSHRGTFLILLLLVSVFLVSCVASSEPTWLRGVFGVDAADYAKEATLQQIDANSQEAKVLGDLVLSLTHNSLNLTSFRSATQAVKSYRDAILNDMLREHYALYTGGLKLSVDSSAYPHGENSTWIPEEDFEQAAARFFGGTSVRHRDGEIFRYVGKSKAYTAPVQAWESSLELAVTDLEETEHTYRMQFRLCDGAETSELYRAIFVKREDGSCYFYELGLV